MPGAIGYIELIYALQNHIDFGLVQNADGKFLKASIDGVTAAAATAKIPADYRVSITNAPGADAYPVSSFTYLLIPTQPKNMANEKIMKDLFSWCIKSGESEVSSLSYAPLPSKLAGEGAPNHLLPAVIHREGSAGRRAPRTFHF